MNTLRSQIRSQIASQLHVREENVTLFTALMFWARMSGMSADVAAYFEGLK